MESDSLGFKFESLPYKICDLENTLTLGLHFFICKMRILKVTLKKLL